MSTDSFSLLPLFSLLPPEGDIREISQYSSAFYARFEEVLQLRKQAESSASTDDVQKYRNEEVMLRNVLEWLAIKPTE